VSLVERVEGKASGKRDHRKAEKIERRRVRGERRANHGRDETENKGNYA